MKATIKTNGATVYLTGVKKTGVDENGNLFNWVQVSKQPERKFVFSVKESELVF